MKPLGADPIREAHRPPPSSGFYAAAAPTEPAGAHGGPRSSTREPRYARGLLRTGDLFLSDDARPCGLDALLEAIDATLPLRALVLVDCERGVARAQTTCAPTREGDVVVARIESAARDAFAYFVEHATTLAGAAESRSDVTLPLVTSAGRVFAVLLASVVAEVSEEDVSFLDAVASQLALALVRDRRSASVRRATTRVLSTIAHERSAHEATRAASRRSAFLADAGAILNRAPDPALDLAQLAHLVANRLAGGCVFVLGTADALERTSAGLVPAGDVDHAAQRLVARASLLGSTLVAAGPSARLATPDDEGWRWDSEAEATRRELGLAWLVCAPIPGRDGATQGALLLLGHDTTSPSDPATTAGFARLLGDALERAQAFRAGRRAMEDRDRVISMVAHELRQPLNAILLNVSAVLGRTPPSGERRRTGREELERVKRALLRLARLTDDLLDLTTIDAPAGRAIRIHCARVEPAELVAEATDLLRAIAAEHGIALRAPTPCALPAIWADAARVQQVLLNLIGNAIKFTPYGGTIRVDARASEGAVAFSVSDTGPGIPEGDRASVFERFWQAKSTSSLGAGIGLTIAKAIVEAHGGHIEVAGAEGVGTTFTFTLPVA